MRIGLLRPIALVSIAIIISAPLYSYKWHVALHIFGAIIFLGNIVVTAAWMALAERTGETTVIRFASKTVSSADVLFTGPGVVLVLLNGLALANDRWGGWGGFHEFSWIVTALGLFAVSGVVWAGWLLRYQYRMVQLSAGVADPLPEEFFHVLHKWYVWGAIATALPLVSLYLMVAKPTLWN